MKKVPLYWIYPGNIELSAYIKQCGAHVWGHLNRDVLLAMTIYDDVHITFLTKNDEKLLPCDIKYREIFSYIEVSVPK